MATRRIKRPQDPFELAKLIGDIATGQVADAVEDGKNEKAVRAGRVAGKVGGKARAETLTAKQRVAIAKKAAAARWK